MAFSSVPAAGAALFTTLMNNPRFRSVCNQGGIILGQGLMSAASTVATMTSLSYLSNITSYFTPSIQLPGFSLGGFSMGDSHIGDIHLPKFEKLDEFDASFLDMMTSVGGGLSTAASMLGQTMLTYTVAYYAAALGRHYLNEYISHSFGQPTLSRNYKFNDWKAKAYEVVSSPYNKVYSAIFGKETKIARKPILHPDVQEQLDDTIFALQNVQKNGGTFANVLLWGPPGTGKSMTAQHIAEDFNMNYMEISGGDLAKFIGSKTSPVEELGHVFKRIKASSVPTVLFIDEFEAIAKERGDLDSARLEIQNAFLNLTGTPSNKVIIVAATNRPQDLDPAILNRFEDKIQMAPPEAKERLEILKMYISEFFPDEQDLAVFTDEFLNHLNDMLTGQTGRTIYKLLNKCLLRKFQQEAGRLSQDLVEKVFSRYFTNEAEITASAPAA